MNNVHRWEESACVDCLRDDLYESIYKFSFICYRCNLGEELVVALMSLEYLNIESLTVMLAVTFCYTVMNILRNLNKYLDNTIRL